MKKIVLSMLFVFAVCSTAFAGEKPRIGVLRFTNHTSASWWHGGTGTDLQDMLIGELAATKRFSVLERKELGSVIGELQLGESGIVDQRTRNKLGRIKGAKYLVAATVSSFEFNTEGSDAGIRVMGFSVGGKKQSAYVAVDLKVIEVETGEIIDSRTIEATSSSGGLRLAGVSGDFAGGLGKESKTPTGKAIRGCIVHIADYLECSMTRSPGDSCHQEFEAKDQKRREKTRRSIELDE